MRTINRIIPPYKKDKNFVIRFTGRREFPIGEFQNNKKFFANAIINKINFPQCLINGIFNNLANNKTTTSRLSFGDFLDGLDIYRDLRYEINAEKPWSPSPASSPDVVSVEIYYETTLEARDIFASYEGTISEDPTIEEAYEAVQDYQSMTHIKAEKGSDPQGLVYNDWNIPLDGEERIFLEGDEICFNEKTGLLDAVPTRVGVGL